MGICMNIQILGSGCATCQKFHKLVREIVDEAGTKDAVEYITGSSGTQKILAMGIMSSPVLIVDGNVVMVGFTPNKHTIHTRIYGHL
jgi:predicted thioredoxin/glutaredoxin